MDMMEKKDLMTNASGYKDETFYKSVTTGPKAGEIWTHNSGAYMLVLSNVRGVCITLRMREEPRGCDNIPVMHRTEMYVSPQFVGYCFGYTLTQFVKCVKDEEMEAVLSGVARVLGIEAAEDADEDDEEENACEEAEEYIDLEARVEELEADLEAARREAGRAEFYREMCDNLLDRLAGRAV